MVGERQKAGESEADHGDRAVTINAVSRSFACTPSSDGVRYTKFAGGSGIEAPAPVERQLDAGHYVPRKFNLVAIHPRPDAETGADAQHRWAYPGIEYRQPICMHGGSAPFVYELIAAPTGATVGEWLEWNGTTGVYDMPTDYGVVKWTPSAEGGPHTFTVRVTGQDGHYADVTWTTEVLASKFIFVSAAASGGGTGVVSDPFTWAECFGTLASTTNNAGKIAVFRGGTFTCAGFSDTNGNLNVNGAIKPKSWIAYPGESPIWDFNGTMKVTVSEGASGAMNDSAVIGIRFRNARQDVNNAHYLYMNDWMSRQIVWRNYFESLDYGLVGSDNPAAIYWTASGGLTDPRLSIAVVQNTFDGMQTGGGNGVAATDSYNIRYGVWERNILKNCTSSYAHWLKGGHQDVSVRYEDMTENNACYALLAFAMAAGTTTISGARTEICYCKIRNPSGTRAVYYLYSSDAADDVDHYIYRNTALGGMAGRLVADGEYNVGDDAEWVALWGASNVTVSASDIDSSGNLAGTSRTAYLGTHGAEIA